MWYREFRELVLTTAVYNPGQSLKQCPGAGIGFTKTNSSQKREPDERR
ncbi:hypothetical protein SAMN04488067_105170 [Halorubrum xinjiangense]|uniref:Uncharacterized protein n=1 Tax=Halorubrum xinjiangense TaxID=261291 RepID=A0A1G7M010_9EURY|nr:hypothetical protein SAMN04488067_105170 [Halorubrum xinjiangense]